MVHGSRISENTANSGPVQRTTRVSSVSTAFSGSGAGGTIASIVLTILSGSGMVTTAPWAAGTEGSVPTCSRTRADAPGTRLAAPVHRPPPGSPVRSLAFGLAAWTLGCLTYRGSPVTREEPDDLAGQPR